MVGLATLFVGVIKARTAYQGPNMKSVLDSPLQQSSHVILGACLSASGARGWWGAGAAGGAGGGRGAARGPAGRAAGCARRGGAAHDRRGALGGGAACRRE